MNTRIYTQANDLKGFSIKNCPSMPEPQAVLMCPPDYYKVSAARNPYMANSVGKVDGAKAQQQWNGVKQAFEDLNLAVKTIAPVEGLEDMVFAANQTLTGLDTKMEKVCLLSHMRHPARRPEVAHFEKWFTDAGYRIARLKDPQMTFEGMGDAVWHPGKRLLWGGHGFRTDPEVYEEAAQVFETPVVRLKLVNERFYHLDTCFCPLNQEAVLIYPPAFDPESLELILKLFPIVLAADEKEASAQLPCNATIINSTAVMQAGAAAAARHVQAIGMKVREVDTSEFLKSGASTFCLKMFLY
jgi:N-dimethylarginine dimethylaminohydrolase